MRDIARANALMAIARVGIRTVAIATSCLSLSPFCGAAQTASRNPAPAMPIVIKDFCPGEGCNFGVWLACQSFEAHVIESAKSPIVFRLKRSTLFRAVTGTLHVTQAGLVAFRDTFRLHDEDVLGPDTLFFTPADTVYPLFYGSEGTGNWYFRGKQSGGPWFISDYHTSFAKSKIVIQLRRAVIHWWIRARNSDGLEGWIDLGSTDYPPLARVEMDPQDLDPPMKCPASY